MSNAECWLITNLVCRICWRILSSFSLSSLMRCSSAARTCSWWSCSSSTRRCLCVYNIELPALSLVQFHYRHVVYATYHCHTSVVMTNDHQWQLLSNPHVTRLQYGKYKACTAVTFSSAIFMIPSKSGHCNQLLEKILLF